MQIWLPLATCVRGCELLCWDATGNLCERLWIAVLGSVHAHVCVCPSRVCQLKPKHWHEKAETYANTIGHLMH